MILFTFQLMPRLPRQIFGKDCFILMSFIARRSRLKVKAESASGGIFELCYFMDLFTSNHSRSYSFAGEIV
jgi:hypothetical protein